MKSWMHGTLPLIAAAWIAASPAAPLGSGTTPEDAASDAVRERVPVIVELFTSEGCSSCPLAESLLREFERKQPVAGVEIIGIVEHVDYWNSLGWTDPFSSEQFTQRQSDYTRRLGSRRVYTPQLVVDGRHELVGSDRAEALRSIADAARQPRARVVVSPAGEKRIGDSTVSLLVRVTDLPDDAAPADVLLAVVETKLVSSITAGENVGRRLRHSAVVRELSVIGKLGARGTFVRETRVRLSDEWISTNLRIVVFVQERPGGRILGAGSTALVTANEPAG